MTAQPQQEATMPTHQCIAMPKQPMEQDRVAYDGALDYQCNAASNEEAWVIFSARSLKRIPIEYRLQRNAVLA
jgi:hypothetical protein